MASIMDPFGNATHTALSFPVIGEDVLITGAGLIGSMAVAICRYAGARYIVVSDLSDARLEIAKKLGATLTVNPSKGEKIDDAVKSLGMVGFDLGWRLYQDGWNHSLFVFQVRGDYYFNTLIGLDKTWDVYAGLQLGPGVMTAPSGYPGSKEGFNFTVDGLAGGRWYFSETMALNAEVGLMGRFETGSPYNVICPY